MSDTILTGDFTVFYASDGNRKQIVWTGGATATRTARETYSALQDLFDDLNQMDEQTPWTAQTPTEFSLVNGWFMDRVTLEHITGGALTSIGFAGVVITRVEYTETVSLIASDIGLPITAPANDGVLVDFEETGATTYLWIRSDAPADTWAVAEAFTITGGTGTGNIVVSTNLSGENVWANLFSLGSLLDAGAQTTLYVLQAGIKLSSYKATTDYWAQGQFDITVLVQEAGVIIDDGFLTVLARRGQSKYSFFKVDASAGGRNPIPLQTEADLDDSDGPRRVGIDLIAGGTPAAGDVMSVSAVNVGIITAYDAGPTPDESEYFLINDPLADFSDNDNVTTQGATTFDIDSTGSPFADVNGNVAAAQAMTVTHANIDRDLNNGAGSRPYSIEIDCNAQALSLMYEHNKYHTRRGEAGTTKTDGQAGEQYIGNELQAEYSAQTGAFVEGEQIFLHDVSDVLVAEATVVADHDDGASGDLIFRDVKIQAGQVASNATQMGDNIVQASYTDFATVDSTRTINPIAASPFGTFAGGTFFGAPGVWITNFAADQSFQLIDDQGVVQNPPNTVSVQITNTRAGDSLSCHRLLGAGLGIDKVEYAVTAAQAAGATSLQVTTTISDEAPKTGSSWGNGGAVVLVDTSAAIEYKLRYTTFATDTFTLFTSSIGFIADATTSPTLLIDAAATFQADGVEPGDLIRNTTAPGIGYVLTVNSETSITLVGTGIAGQTVGDTYDIGTLPVLTEGGDVDDAYVPFILREEDTGTDGTPGAEFASIVQTVTIEIRIRVRQAGNILPFEADAQITATGVSVATIRSPDTIYE
jgi:hypothetical protein